MKALFRAAVAAAVLASPALAQTPEPQPIVIQAARAYVDVAKPPIAPAYVTVVGGRITAVSSTPPAAGELIDLGARTLLPGLIDTHVHLTSEPGQGFANRVLRNEAYLMAVGAKNAKLTLEAGFTTVRDLGAPPTQGQALRDAIKDGLIPGPRIQTAGQGVTIVGGHFDDGVGFNALVAQALSVAGLNTCTGAVQCAELVRTQSREGVDWIKIAATGGVTSQQNRGLGAHFTQEELNAIVSTARQLGIPVTAHAHSAEGVRMAAEAGVSSIEHGTFMDEAAARAMKKAGAMLAPTYMPARQYQENMDKGVYSPVVLGKIKERMAALGRNVRMAKAAGVELAFGSDTGVSPHGRNGEEFDMLVTHAGLTPRETLVMATTSAAKLLGLSAEIGTLEAGKSADLIAVDGDPLANVRVLEKPAFVMARGRVAKTP